jgi:hypothetical protein
VRRGVNILARLFVTKVVPVLNKLSITPRRCMGGMDVKIHILTLALAGGEWSDSRPSHFTPGEITPGTH